MGAKATKSAKGRKSNTNLNRRGAESRRRARTSGTSPRLCASAVQLFFFLLHRRTWHLGGLGAHPHGQTIHETQPSVQPLLQPVRFAFLLHSTPHKDRNGSVPAWRGKKSRRGDGVEGEVNCPSGVPSAQSRVDPVSLKGVRKKIEWPADHSPSTQSNSPDGKQDRDPHRSNRPMSRMRHCKCFLRNKHAGMHGPGFRAAL
jgi:hypothetical protein